MSISHNHVVIRSHTNGEWKWQKCVRSRWTSRYQKLFCSASTKEIEIVQSESISVKSENESGQKVACPRAALIFAKPKGRRCWHTLHCCKRHCTGCFAIRTDLCGKRADDDQKNKQRLTRDGVFCHQEWVIVLLGIASAWECEWVRVVSRKPAELRDKNLLFACSFQLTALIFLSAKNKQDDLLITWKCFWIHGWINNLYCIRHS